MAGRHVIQVLSLPHIFTITKEKLCSECRNTVSISVPQVACGAYHSLALVRCLPPQNTQNPPEKRERGQSPHYLVTERDETSNVDYCPLGVELTEVLTGEVTILQEGEVKETTPYCNQKDIKLQNEEL